MFLPPFLPKLAAVVDRLVHPASHRHRRRVLPRAQRRRTRPDLSGSPRHAQPPEDSRDWPNGLAIPRVHARTL